MWVTSHGSSECSILNAEVGVDWDTTGHQSSVLPEKNATKIHFKHMYIDEIYEIIRTDWNDY